MSKKSIRHSKELKVLAAVVLLGIVLWLVIPVTDGGITPKGAVFASVFVCTIVLWVTVDPGWGTFLSIAVLIVFGAIDAQTAFSTVWGSSITVTIIALSIINQAMRQSGMIQYIAKWCLSRKIVHNRPAVFFAMYCVTLWILGSFSSETVLCFMMVGVVNEICASCGYGKDDDFYRALLMLTLWVAAPLGGVLPFGRSLILSILSILSSYGIDINIVDWLRLSLPFGIILTIVAVAFVMLVVRPDMTKLRAFDDEAVRKELMETKLSRSAKVAACSTVFFMLAWLLQGINLGPVSRYLSTWGYATPCVIGVIALVLIPDANGEPILDFKEALSSVPWSLILFVGGITLYSSVFGRDEYGISAALSGLLNPLTNSLPLTATAVIGLIIAGIATQFGSNRVAGLITTTVFVGVFKTIGQLPDSLIVAFAVGVGCLVSCPYCTPAASPAVGATFNEQTLPLKRCVKYNILFFIIAVMIAVLYFLLIRHM